MFLLVFPLAFLPYIASYTLWIGAGGAAFGAASRIVWNDKLALFCVLAAPATFQAVITGQTGFFTAALLITASIFAGKRPVLAGVAAGLLTVKPQLGLLIPFAFAAAGYWRAFGVAAITAVFLVGVSLTVFGVELWTEFLGSISEHGGRLQSDLFPIYKIISVYGGLFLLGAPAKFALGAQVIVTLALMAATAFVWRRVNDRDLRIAFLCAATPLATPYAMYYEMTMMLPALLVIARRGVEGGWLYGEKAALAALWAAPMFVLMADQRPGLPLGFVVSAALFAIVTRRVWAAVKAQHQDNQHLLNSSAKN